MEEGRLGGNWVGDLLVGGVGWGCVGAEIRVLAEPEPISPLDAGLPSVASLRFSTRQRRHPVGVAS